jgi:hypothetical protein
VLNKTADRTTNFAGSATTPAKVAKVAKVETAVDYDAIEERAAIVHFDGGAPVE